TDQVGATPIVLPLTEADVGFSDPTTVDLPDNNPANAEYCENTPVTDGLVDWRAGSIEASGSLPTLYQSLTRFETDQEAAAYLESLIGTIDCEEWSQDDVVFRPMVETPVGAWGDDTRQVHAELNSSGLIGHLRAIYVRDGSEVLYVSILTLRPSELDGLPNLVTVATDRLDF
ncbi:MAG: hypothetical protein ACK5PP_17960, partial [Acidimicrobiales bacterium]